MHLKHVSTFPKLKLWRNKHANHCSRHGYSRPHGRVGAGQQVRAIGTPIEAWFYDAAGNRFRAPGFGVEDHSFALMSRPVLNEVLADAAGRKNIRFNRKVTGFKEDANGMISVESPDAVNLELDRFLRSL
jgi:hypothetical protein